MSTGKTNKSYMKRLKVTKNGKIKARVPGQDHFNAKENRRQQQRKGRSTNFVMKNKAISRYLAS